MERALITGSHGFLGEHLVASLEQQGCKVVRLSRDWRSLPKADYIFHLGAYGNKYDQQDEEKIFKANVVRTWDLLMASKDMPYKAFINVSSSSTLLPTETFYSATKAAMERICRAFVDKYDKPVVTVRPYSVYGLGDDPKHFIPVAIDAFKTNKDLTLAKGVHDWIHIEDLVEGIKIVVKNAEELKGREVNIGTGLQTSNYEIVSILRQVSGLPGKVKHVEQLRSYDTTFWVADNSLLCSFGWEPQHNLEGDLEKMYYGA